MTSGGHVPYRHTYAYARAARPAVAMPLYLYPGADGGAWAPAVRASGDTMFVVNIADGPGDFFDTYYLDAIAALRARGHVVLGYVDTDYGRRARRCVLADVRKWCTVYGLRGVFLDRAVLTRALAGYYTALAVDCRSLGLTIGVNPGQPHVDPDLVALYDAVLVFEGSALEHEATSFPRWMREGGPDNLWHAVYECGAPLLDGVVARAMAAGARFVFATDAILPNPWDRFPPFFRELSTAVNLRG